MSREDRWMEPPRRVEKFVFGFIESKQAVNGHEQNDSRLIKFCNLRILKNQCEGGKFGDGTVKPANSKFKVEQKKSQKVSLTQLQLCLRSASCATNQQTLG